MNLQPPTTAQRSWTVTTASYVLPARGQTNSGDRAWVRRFGADVVVAVLLDVAGHGVRAAQQAERLVQLLQTLPDGPPAQWLHRLHQELRGTFGAVGAVIRVDLATGTVQAVSVGDLSMFCEPAETIPMLKAAGLLGIAMPGLQSSPGSLSGAIQNEVGPFLGEAGPGRTATGPLRLVAVTDGVRSAGLLRVSQLRHLAAADFAEAVVLGHARPHDDAACLVVDIAPADWR